MIPAFRQAFLSRLLIFLLTATIGWAALAQEQPAGPVLPDPQEWAAQVSAAEALIADDESAVEDLERLRTIISGRRAAFLAAQSANAARIATAEAQIAALGPLPPEGETEDPEIAERRARLNAQLAELRRPVVAAEEGFALANSLVASIDSTIRDRYARQLLARQPSPLNPVLWPSALTVLTDTVQRIGTEARDAWRNPDSRAVALQAAPLSAFLGFVGLLLALRSRWWVGLFADWVAPRWPRGQGVLDFALSLGQIVLPLAGVMLVALAIDLTHILGEAGRIVIVVGLPTVALPVILSRWLVLRLFPQAEPCLLPVTKRDGGRLRRLGVIAGHFVAANIALGGVETQLGYSDLSVSVLQYPLRLLTAFLLWRIGRILLRARRPDPQAENELRLGETFVRTLGRVAMAIALLSVVLATAGYSIATQGILVPAFATLGLGGLLVVLQRLIGDVYALVTRTSESSASDALAPILAGFVLSLAAIPVLALLWGARVADLSEMWQRFLLGFAVGETRISPDVFLVFAIVFAVGLALTRLAQRTLRGSVLPRTAMDVGARNAIVSGTGYIGIFLAILLAITSAGIDLSNLAIVAGALSLGIGFGLQNVVSNFVSGIILLIERPISEGDWIEVGGQMGYVRDISVRSTRIETFDRTDVIVPNADLVSGTVTNWTRGNLVGRVIVPVGVAFGTDTRLVEAILMEIAEAHPLVVLNPPPAVLFRTFGNGALNFEIRAILRDVNFVLAVQSDMNHEIAARFAAEGIVIPHSQHDLWLRNPETLVGPSASVS
ncbi:Small Conductance Mechanosensitive Ion Channel [Oceaniovalibus guishaninsula JLT2003]|uniref:Small Conductance Mechanosensitive Ion Channel n=1 Tax=Oceaniovalibus guishaninsula JLT2003 TaxID=1231392 RepID=K2GN10_9RHOB|nr:DUF3772 domain-containing protein [Oceaniovalibus guishaninsula]EKE44061.1 Small Conductance Mechanosensitive Ion Channel [Oceaniovalibus guishaninsula JLT2003]